MNNEQAKAIIKEYYRYIESVANRYRLPEHHDDLMQVGRIAAIQSFDTFDPTKSDEIKGHICSNIKYAISKYVDENLRTIRIPNHILYSKDEEDKAMMITTLQLDLVINDEGGTVIDLIPSSEPTIPIEPNEALKKALMTLNEKERQILTLHLDLNDESQPMTLSDIGKLMGVTRERARQLYQRAISKLQVEMGVEVKSNKIKHTTTWYARNKKQFK